MPILNNKSYNNFRDERQCEEGCKTLPDARWAYENKYACQGWDWLPSQFDVVSLYCDAKPKRE